MKLAPAIEADKARAEREHRDIVRTFGRLIPENMDRRKLRAMQLRRVLAVFGECQQWDVLTDAERYDMREPLWIVRPVFRARTVRRVIRR